MVEVDDVAKAADARLYMLPPGHCEALTQPDSLYYIAPLALLPAGGMAGILPRLLEAYRTGGGIPFADYGADFYSGAVNRAVYLHHLGRWIAAGLPAYPRPARRQSREDSRRRLRRRLVEHRPGEVLSPGTGRRVRSRRGRAGRGREERGGGRRRRSSRLHAPRGDLAAPGGGYDLVCILDALHDMARPVDVLGTCRAMLAEGGSVLLLEPNAGEAFAAPAGEVERFLYAISLLHCLPVGLSERPSAATGTVLRPETVRAYASAAGFTRVEIVPIEQRFHRLYHLTV